MIQRMNMKVISLVTIMYEIKEISILYTQSMLFFPFFSFFMLLLLFPLMYVCIECRVPKLLTLYCIHYKFWKLFIAFV